MHAEFDEDDREPSAPFWMTTYGDMVTLLLTFFILLVSMSSVEVKRFKQALSYFSGGTGVLQYVSPRPAEPRTPDEAFRYEALLRYLEAQGLEDKVQAEITDEGLHVVINDSVMFRSGEAALLAPSRSLLRMVAGVVRQQVGRVTVEGHTDDQPIRTSLFPSNWELSAARAASVVRFLLEQPDALPPDRYGIAGYGEHRPVGTNRTAQGRARNRRVEILFSWETWPERTTPQPPPTPAR